LYWANLTDEGRAARIAGLKRGWVSRKARR
jgi:hypothetical protein